MGGCSARESHALVMRYRAKEMDEKACGIIDEFRLLLQVLSIDDRAYRHRCNAPEGREAAFGGERAVTSDEVNGRVIGVRDNAAGGLLNRNSRNSSSLP